MCHNFFFKDMFKLGEMNPINFYIEAYGKYTNSGIIWTQFDFKQILLLDS